MKSDQLGTSWKTTILAFRFSFILTWNEINQSSGVLFTADRAKAIKTKAVVNESPTEKLIRELREENQRLLEQLKMSGGGQPIVMQAEPGEPQMVGISEEGSLILIR